MNKKILAAAIAASLVAPITISAATDTDTQNVVITVPEVALIAISGGDVSLPAFPDNQKPTNAGEGFSGTVDNNAGLAISANVQATTRTLSVQVGSKVPLGGQLVVSIDTSDYTGTPGTPSPVTFVNSDTINTDQTLLSGIGNVFGTSTDSITYSFGPEGGGTGMISYTGDGATADTILLTYTLSEDG